MQSFTVRQATSPYCPPASIHNGEEFFVSQDGPRALSFLSRHKAACSLAPREWERSSPLAVIDTMTVSRSTKIRPHPAPITASLTPDRLTKAEHTSTSTYLLPSLPHPCFSCTFFPTIRSHELPFHLFIHIYTHFLPPFAIN